MHQNKFEIWSNSNCRKPQKNISTNSWHPVGIAQSFESLATKLFKQFKCASTNVFDTTHWQICTQTPTLPHEPIIIEQNRRKRHQLHAIRRIGCVWMRSFPLISYSVCTLLCVCMYISIYRALYVRKYR